MIDGKNMLELKLSIDSDKSISGEVVEIKSIPSSKSTKVNGIKPIVLRLSKKLHDKLITLLENRTVPVTRHQWIVEAIAEKLDKECS